MLLTACVVAGSFLQGLGADESAMTVIRERAAWRVGEIRATPNAVVPAGAAARYVSAHGDDGADGLTPQTAWRTIARLNREKLAPGAFVLFARGGVYRGTVMAQAGVTYTAYGTGPKPCIYGSPANGADPSKWTRTENPKVWAYDIGHDDVGTLVFDDGAAHAIKIVIRTDKRTGRKYNKYTGGKFDSYRDLDCDLHFWHDYYKDGTGKLYLYSEQNPGARFRSIEFNVKCCGFRVNREPDVTIDNFTVKYVGIHGVAAGTCRNLTVRNCAFEWIGGSIQAEAIFGRDYPTRLGNGVEIYGGCDGFTVSNCCFREVYDAGVTQQYNIPEKKGMERCDQKHIRYVDNVFERCNYSVEYFLTAKSGNPSLMEDFRIEDNIMLDAGYGFAEQRPDRDQAAHIKAWYCGERNRAKDYVIRRNAICLSIDMLTQTCSALKNADGSSSLPRYEDNVFVGREGDCLGEITDTAKPRVTYDAAAETFVNSFGSGNRCLILPRSARGGIPFDMPALKAPVFPARDFSIADFGARADGSKCTAAFAQAMDACAKAGGGRVVVPDGTWTTGPIHFRSNCELHLADKAVIAFTDDPADYLPAVHTTWEGVECLNYSPLVYAYGVENVSITGKGLLRPKMDLWEKWFVRGEAHMRATECLYHWCSTNAPLAARNVPAIEGSNVRPHLIQMNRAKNVLLDGFRIQGSPFWMIHLYHSENCIVRNLDTYAHGHNNDGVDIEMTRNVLVENCTFDQGDDGIVLKAGRNQDAWRLNRPTENVVVTNCTFKFAHTLVGIGSELSGGIRNFYMSDCRIHGSYNLLYVKTNRRRGGFVENITVENIDTDFVRWALFGLKTDILYQWAKFPDYELRYTRIADVNVRNVHARCADWMFDIEGDAHLPARGLHFENVTLDSARKGVSRIVNARDIDMRGIRFGSVDPVAWEQPVREFWHKNGPMVK